MSYTNDSWTNNSDVADVVVSALAAKLGITSEAAEHLVKQVAATLEIRAEAEA